MRTGVVILNWRDADASIRCAAEVRRWTSLAPKVIVVDNGSGDGSLEKIRKNLPGVELLRLAENTGYGGGNNAGIRRALQAGCNAVLLLNSDASIDDANMAALARELENGDGLDIVGPVLVESEGGEEQLCEGGRDILRHLTTRLFYPMTERAAREAEGPHAYPDYIPGTVLLAKAAVFERVGLLDEDFFCGGETADFCARARHEGLRFAVCRHVVAHHRKGGPDGRRRVLNAYYNTRSRFLFARKHCGRRSVLFAVRWAALGAAASLGELFFLRTALARAFLLGTVDGLRGRWGNRNGLFGA